MANFGNTAMLGDSLFRGNDVAPAYYSPANKLKSLLSDAEHSATFVGLHNAFPGSVPVASNGGWTIATLQTNRAATVALSPQTIILQIGTNFLSGPNGSSTAAADITQLLNDYKADTASITGRRFYIFAPVNLSWFHQPSWTAMKEAMEDWVADNSSFAYFGDLTEAGLNISGSDGIGDGTHWSSAGADKIAAYIFGVMENSLSEGPVLTDTRVTFQGIDHVSVMQSAAAQAVGLQKAKYCQLVVEALGSNPVFEIRVGSTVVYQSTINGTLSYSSQGIVFPSQFVEPPSINVANALTSGQLVLRNASNTSVSVSVPLKVGGDTGFLTASKSLDGTNAVRTNALRFLAPVTLDVGSGGNPGGDPGGSTGLYSAQRLKDAMTLVNQNQWGLELAPNTDRGSDVYAQITVAINRSDGNSGYPDDYLSDNSLPRPGKSNLSISDSSSVKLQCWYVWGRAKQATTPRASNTRLQIRNNRLWIKLRNGAWQQTPAAEKLGDAIVGASWHANFAYPGNEDYEDVAQGNLLYQNRVESSNNGGGSSLGAIGYGGFGTNTARDGSTLKRFEHYTLHNYPISLTANRKWWVDNVLGFVQVCEARLIVHDSSQPDDRANANLMCWAGADWYINGDYITNGAGVGRLTLVTNDWQIFPWGIYDTDDILTSMPPGFTLNG